MRLCGSIVRVVYWLVVECWYQQNIGMFETENTSKKTNQKEKEEVDVQKGELQKCLLENVNAS